MLIEPEQENVAIVIVGDFNPPIFNPDWLLRNNLIGTQAADQSHIDVIHSELAQFNVGVLDFIIERQKLQISTRVAPFIKLADFVSKAFREALPHTPLKKFGINRAVHFKLPSEEIRNNVGRLLAPVEPWGDWGQTISRGSGQFRGGMVNLSMQEARECNDFVEKITATVQPSALIPGGLGIFVHVNDDFELKREDTESIVLLDKIDQCFDTSYEEAGKIIDCVMALKDSPNV